MIIYSRLIYCAFVLLCMFCSHASTGGLMGQQAAQVVFEIMQFLDDPALSEPDLYHPESKSLMHYPGPEVSVTTSPSKTFEELMRELDEIKPFSNDKNAVFRRVLSDDLCSYIKMPDVQALSDSQQRIYSLKFLYRVAKQLYPYPHAFIPGIRYTITRDQGIKRGIEKTINIKEECGKIAIILGFGFKEDTEWSTYKEKLDSEDCVLACYGLIWYKVSDFSISENPVVKALQKSIISDVTAMGNFSIWGFYLPSLETSSWPKEKMQEDIRKALNFLKIDPAIIDEITDEFGKHWEDKLSDPE